MKTRKRTQAQIEAEYELLWLVLSGIDGMTVGAVERYVEIADACGVPVAFQMIDARYPATPEPSSSLTGAQILCGAACAPILYLFVCLLMRLAGCVWPGGPF